MPQKSFGVVEYLATFVAGTVIAPVLFLHVQLKELERLAALLTELCFQPNGFMTPFSIDANRKK